MSTFAPISRAGLIRNSEGVDLWPDQVASIARLTEAATLAYGTPCVRVDVEGGNVGVQIRVRGDEPQTFVLDEQGCWTTEGGSLVRWDLTYHDELPAGIVWTAVNA